MERHRLAAIIAGAATVLALAPTSIGPAAAGGCWSSKGSERGFARRINGARHGRGIGRLKLDPQLSRVARKHSAEMDRGNRLYHTPSSKLRRRVTHWSMLGENVGVGGSVKSLHKAFMRSAPHKHNVLGRSYRYVGVGTRSDGGTLWVTVIFEASKNPGTRLAMSC